MEDCSRARRIPNRSNHGHCSRDGGTFRAFTERLNKLPQPEQLPQPTRSGLPKNRYPTVFCHHCSFAGIMAGGGGRFFGFVRFAGGWVAVFSAAEVGV